MNHAKKIISQVDTPLIYLILILLFFGLSIMFSGSTVTAQREFSDPMYFVKKQALWISISLIFFLIFINIPYLIYKKYSQYLILLSLFLLSIVFVPYIGKSVSTNYGRNFHRWIGIGSVQVQPSEFSKIAIIIYISATILRLQQNSYTKFQSYIFPGIIVLLMLTLLIAEPAFGTTVEIFCMIVILIFIAGFSIKKLLFGFTSLIPLVFILVYYVGYRKKRIEVWLDPYKYRFEEGHQLVSSFKAFAEGSVFGNPLATGYSHRYLTYCHTDFVMATFVEDFGFFGFLILFLLFLLLLGRLFYLVMKTREPFGFLLGTGIIAMLSIQILINLFVVTGVLPITGISLPFISYGGSSLLTIMISLGIFINITKRGNIT